MASLYLFGTFVRRLFPINEMPSSGLNSLSIILELAMAFAVVGLGVRVLKSIPPQSSARGGWVALMVAGMIGALGIFGIRLSGGPRVELPPRPVQVETKAATLPPDLEKLATRAGAVTTTYQKAETAAVNSRWANTEPREYRTLPRSALTEQIGLERDLVEATDRVIELLEEPGFETEMTRLASLARTQGRRVPELDLKPDGWRLLRRIYAGSRRMLILVDENWDEWRATPTITEDGKPWQKEILALVKEIEIADKEHDALIEARAVAAGAAKPTPGAEEIIAAKLKARIKDLQVSCDNLQAKLAKTRWAQTGKGDPSDGQGAYLFAAAPVHAISALQKLSLEDLSAFREAEEKLLGPVNDMVRRFQEAESLRMDLFAGENALALEFSPVAGKADARAQNWRVAHRLYAIAYEQSGLIEQNWEDWRRSGSKSKGKQKPWQEKAQQLQNEFDSAFKEWEGLR